MKPAKDRGGDPARMERPPLGGILAEPCERSQESGLAHTRFKLTFGHFALAPMGSEPQGEVAAGSPSSGNGLKEKV